MKGPGVGRRLARDTATITWVVRLVNVGGALGGDTLDAAWAEAIKMILEPAVSYTLDPLRPVEPLPS